MQNINNIKIPTLKELGMTEKDFYNESMQALIDLQAQGEFLDIPIDPIILQKEINSTINYIIAKILMDKDFHYTSFSVIAKDEEIWWECRNGLGCLKTYEKIDLCYYKERPLSLLQLIKKCEIFNLGCDIRVLNEEFLTIEINICKLTEEDKIKLRNRFGDKWFNNDYDYVFLFFSALHYNKEEKNKEILKEKKENNHKSKIQKTPQQIERTKLTAGLRYDILKRDNFKCQICGRSVEDGVKLHVDHIIPISKGGKTEWNNLRTLCQDCNLGKGNKIEL